MRQITERDLQLEKFFNDTVAKRPQRKNEETITWWDRQVFWYDKDEVARQSRDVAANPAKVTYEDHRIAVETAVTIFGAKSSHQIAMEILSSRHFRPYRAKAFKGMGTFHNDYSFLIKKIGVLFNHHKAHIIHSSAATKLAAMEGPALVQINHITGSVTKVILPKSSNSLDRWAVLFNSGAPESTTYKAIAAPYKPSEAKAA